MASGRENPGGLRPGAAAGREQRLLAEARAAERRGDVRAAVAIYTGLLKLRPGDVGLKAALGHGLTRLGRTSEARKHLSAVLKRRPTSMAYRDLARCHELEGNPEEAVRVTDRGLRENPGEPVLIAARAGALAAQGAYEEAWSAVRGVSGATGHPAVVLALARVAGPAGRAGEGIDTLRRALDSPEFPAGSRVPAMFQLASLLDGAGEHEAAFDAAAEANRLQGGRFDREAFEADVGRMLGAWTPDAVRGLPRALDETRLPVFIVGMPRSGTSLVEQVIASHPQAFGGGELHVVWEVVGELNGMPKPVPLVDEPGLLTGAVVRRQGRRVVTSMRRQGRGAARVTDKQPANCFHVGVLSVLTPGATVVHCRRDAMDACVSCFLQGFGAGVPFASDFEDLACYHAAVDRVMEHWKRTLDVRIVEVVYERLVEDFEAASRSLIDAVGLEWDEACARFHEARRSVATASADQVRKPLYGSSVGRWRRYGDRVAPLRAALERRGVAVE